MNMMAGPPLFKRSIVQTGEARAMLHPALSQDLEEAIDKRCNQLLLSFGCLTLDFGSTYNSHVALTCLDNAASAVASAVAATTNTNYLSWSVH